MGLPELGRAAARRADRHFIETNFPVSLSDSESRSAQAKDQRSSGLLQLESHFRKLERRAAEGLRLKIREAQACFNLNHISGNLREEQLKGTHWVGHGYCHDHQLHPGINIYIIIIYI